eukprot:scaffold4050_cov118-Skeletonema_marinoi.AAC.5
MDNVIDNLLYADSMNLALLKEVVMDFLAENHDEAVTKDFSNIPGHLMRDLLVAFGMSKRAGKGNGKEKDFKAMRVSELRMKLAKAGLDVDGSREAMIEALNANAIEIAMNEDSESDEGSESDSDSDDDSEES